MYKRQELIAFSLKTKNNEKIKERIISSFDKFIDADSMSDREIVQTSRKLKIDIAVDLMGFTNSNRFGIYDISNLDDIELLATIPCEGYAHNAWLTNHGTHLITTEETQNKTVKIWDIYMFR